MYHITTCTLLFWNPNISWNKALGLQVGRILAATAGSNTVTRTIDLPTPYTIVLLWLRKTVKCRNSFYFKIRMRSLFLLWNYIYQKVEYGPLSYLKTRITLFFFIFCFLAGTWTRTYRARDRWYKILHAVETLSNLQEGGRLDDSVLERWLFYCRSGLLIGCCLYRRSLE